MKQKITAQLGTLIEQIKPEADLINKNKQRREGSE